MSEPLEARGELKLRPPKVGQLFLEVTAKKAAAS